MGFLGEKMVKKQSPYGASGWLGGAEEKALLTGVVKDAQGIATKAAGIGDETFAWSKDLAATEQATTSKVVETQLGMGLSSAKTFAESYDPIDKKVAADAMAFDSPERMEAEAARASSGVAQSFEAARGREGTRLARYGLRPEDTAGGEAAIAQAAAQATASNEARRNVELTGIQLRQQAQQAGRGVQAAGLSAVQAAAGTAVGTADALLKQREAATVPYLQAQTQATGVAGQTAASMYGTGAKAAGDVLDYNIKGKQIVSNQISNIVGGIAGGMSSKRVKHSKAPTSGKAALSAVKKTKVESWKYKPGVEDGGAKRHVGPYAEDVRKNMGERAAPGGKMVDLMSLNGINMAAIKELSSKVDAISKKIGLRGARHG